MKELLERFAGPKRWNWELEDGGVFGEIIVYHLRLLSAQIIVVVSGVSLKKVVYRVCLTIFSQFSSGWQSLGQFHQTLLLVLRKYHARTLRCLPEDRGRRFCHGKNNPSLNGALFSHAAHPEAFSFVSHFPCIVSLNRRYTESHGRICRKKVMKILVHGSGPSHGRFGSQLGPCLIFWVCFFAFSFTRFFGRQSGVQKPLLYIHWDFWLFDGTQKGTRI